MEGAKGRKREACREGADPVQPSRGDSGARPCPGAAARNRCHLVLPGCRAMNPAVYEIGSGAGTESTTLQEPLRAFDISRFPFSPETLDPEPGIAQQDEGRLLTRVVRYG